MDTNTSLDIMGNSRFGKAALRKLAPVPTNFRIYAAGWIGTRPEKWNAMKVSGAQFRPAKRGPRAGQMCILIPRTVRHTVVTREEMAAAEEAQTSER